MIQGTGKWNKVNIVDLFDNIMPLWFCPLHLTSLLRHVHVNRLVWIWFLHEKISIPVRYKTYCFLYGDSTGDLGHFDTVHSEIFSRTLFDFKKSISGSIELEFSGMTLKVSSDTIIG